jgi:hypothetical protein
VDLLKYDLLKQKGCVKNLTQPFLYVGTHGLEPHGLSRLQAGCSEPTELAPHDKFLNDNVLKNKNPEEIRGLLWEHTASNRMDSPAYKRDALNQLS